MNDKWHSENFVFKNGVSYENAGGGFVWIEEFLPNEFRKAEYGPLFAYMYRRFGIPQYGSDDHKEIANWYITTPDVDVAVRISPKPSGIIHSIGYVINPIKYSNRRDDEQVKSVQSAMVAAIMDLLTPVFVRDTPINALGRVEGDPYEDCCDEWKWAGYGVSAKYFEEEYGQE